MTELTEILRGEKFSHSEIVSAFEAFDDLRLLEDASDSESYLKPNDIDRWARNLNFFGSFCRFGENKQIPQKKIQDCKITLLGLGGLGSHLLYDLAALGCKDIRAVEFDDVEISNLNRQILYTPSEIGQPKAEVARKRILGFSPDLKFEVYNQKIQNFADVATAMVDRDIAICVADRPKTEILYWVNEACVKARIPLLTGGLDTQVCRYYCTLPGEGCLECWRSRVRKNQPKSHEILEEQRRTQLRGDNAAFVPFVAILAGLMIAEFTKIMTGIGGKPNAQNKTREINFSSMTIETGETWNKDPSCSCCSVP